MADCPTLFDVKEYQIRIPGYHTFILKTGSNMFIRMPSDEFSAGSFFSFFKVKISPLLIS